MSTRRELDKSPQRIRSLFEQIAPRYDGINHALSLGIDRSWRRKTVELIFKRFAPEVPRGPFLDVCCGTADLTLALYKRCAKEWAETNDSVADFPDVRDRNVIVGLDFSPAMLKIGREKIEKNGAQNQITLCEGDALDLPFESDLFSVTSVAFGLRNEENLVRGLAEMVRVTKIGGVVAILDFDLPRLPVISSLYRFYLTQVLPRFGQWVSRNRDGAYQYFSQSIVAFEKGESLAQRMREAGLENVTFHRFTFGTTTLYLGTKGKA